MTPLFTAGYVITSTLNSFFPITWHVHPLILDRKKYTSGPRYWNVPVLVNTGTFLVYQYCLKMWYLRSLEQAGVIQKLTILECKNCLVLSNTHVPVSGTSSILFPLDHQFGYLSVINHPIFSPQCIVWSRTYHAPFQMLKVDCKVGGGPNFGRFITGE